MSDHSSWEELTSENERIIGPADAHNRTPAGAAGSTAGVPARHGKGGSDGAGSLATKLVPSRTRRWRVPRKSAGSGPVLP